VLGEDGNDGCGTCRKRGYHRHVACLIISDRYCTFLLDDTQVKFRDYAKAIAETKSSMTADASSAFFSMTQAEYAAGNFKQKVAEGSMTARVRIGAGVNNVAGVKLPVFTKYDTGAAADNQSLGLVGGGKKIVAVREKFTDLLVMLIKYVVRAVVDSVRGECPDLLMSTLL
jgi:ATP synthase subunit D